MICWHCISAGKVRVERVYVMMGGVGGFCSGFGIYDKWPFYPCLIQVYRLNINLSNLILNFALYRKNHGNLT